MSDADLLARAGIPTPERIQQVGELLAGDGRIEKGPGRNSLPYSFGDSHRGVLSMDLSRVSSRF